MNDDKDNNSLDDLTKDLMDFIRNRTDIEPIITVGQIKTLPKPQLEPEEEKKVRK